MLSIYNIINYRKLIVLMIVAITEFAKSELATAIKVTNHQIVLLRLVLIIVMEMEYVKKDSVNVGIISKEMIALNKFV